jgi:subtilase family protein
MFDQEARLERLLIRHPDAAVVEPITGRPTLIRRDQLLVAAQDVPIVEGLVRRWEESRHDEAGVCRLRLRRPARVDVCELAHQLGSDGRHRRLAVAPNTLVYGQPMWWSGPADRPRPAVPVPAPTAERPPQRDVTVAVLDTGLSPHPWFEATDWYAAQAEEAAEVLDADLDFELDAQAGHGTFVTGVLLRAAPAAQVRALRVIGGDGVGDEFDVIRALAGLAAWGRADIVNMSLGCYTYDDRPSPVLARSIAALGRRTVVVACAGNAASDRPFWPAALKHVIAVAARCGGDRAWFSNYGWWVDACAPGVDVTSSFVRFDGPFSFQGYATWSGTSFAAPAVAGLIAARAAMEDLPTVTAADQILNPAASPTLPDLGVLLPAP